jgi:hypothetical protein
MGDINEFNCFMAGEDDEDSDLGFRETPGQAGDLLKAVNAATGHAFSDRVLRQVRELIARDLIEDDGTATPAYTLPVITEADDSAGRSAHGGHEAEYPPSIRSTDARRPTIKLVPRFLVAASIAAALVIAGLANDFVPPTGGVQDRMALGTDRSRSIPEGSQALPRGIGAPANDQVMPTVKDRIALGRDKPPTSPGVSHTPTPGIEGPAQGPVVNSSPENVLASRGLDLKRDNKRAILEDEAPVIEKYKEATKVYAALQEAFFTLGAIDNRDATLRDLQVEKRQCQIEIDSLNIQIDSMPNRFNNRQLNLNSTQRPLLDMTSAYRARINNIDRQIQMLNTIPRTPNDRAKAVAAFERTNKQWVEVAGELQGIIDQVSGKYAELKKEKAVNDALKEVNRLKKAAYKLGPSDGFNLVVKQFKGALSKKMGKKIGN